MLIDQDRDLQLELLPEHLWRRLHGQRLLLTGGTGFVGRWLLELLCGAANRFDLDLEIQVISRDPARFLESAPELARHALLDWWQGDVQDYHADAFAPTLVLHGATPAGLRNTSGETVAAEIAASTQAFLERLDGQPLRRLLFVSSGAVYGQVSELQKTPQTWSEIDSLKNPRSPYGEGKWRSEQLAAEWTDIHGIDLGVARCFTFVGPFMPLDAGYAVSDLLRQAIHGQDLVINGSGKSLRSYLYGGDLARYLLTMLLHNDGADLYNIGSSQPLSILALAETLRDRFAPGSRIRVLGNSDLQESCYLPNTSRAEQRLGLLPGVSLDEAMLAYKNWALELAG